MMKPTLGTLIGCWGRLKQRCGNVIGLTQQKPAYLCDVRTRGDVQMILLSFRIETILCAEVEQRTVHLLKIPRVRHVNRVQDNLCSGRRLFDVLLNAVRKPRVVPVMNQLKAIHWKVILLTHTHAWSPSLPAFRSLAPHVQNGSDQSHNDVFHLIFLDKL